MFQKSATHLFYKLFSVVLFVGLIFSNLSFVNAYSVNRQRSTWETLAPYSIVYSDGSGLYALDPLTKQSNLIGPDFAVPSNYFVETDKISSIDAWPSDILIRDDYTFTSGLLSPQGNSLVYVEAICTASRCQNVYSAWLVNVVTHQRRLIMDEKRLGDRLPRPVAWSLDGGTIYFDTYDLEKDVPYAGLLRYSISTGQSNWVDLGPGYYNGEFWLSPDRKYLLTTGFAQPSGTSFDALNSPTSRIKLIDVGDGAVATIANSPHQQSYYFVKGWTTNDKLQGIVKLADAAPDPGIILAVPEATSGFQRPMTNDHYGWEWLQWTGSVYHPGDDYNGPGAGDTDCGTDIYAVANGEVKYVNTGGWGGIVIQHSWQGVTVYSQYGHISYSYVSNGQQVTKGQHIAEVGKVGATSCHLHWEFRESDHPNPTDGNYYSNLTQSNVENWYEDPEWWADNHGPYNSCDATSIPGGYTKCAEEGDGNWCNFSGLKTVYYGANSCYAVEQKSNGVECTNGNFGGDPLPGVHKACYIQQETSCPQDGGVILYWNANYNCSNDRGDQGYRQRTSTGSQNVNDGQFNDQVSSVKIPNGWSVRLFNDADGFGGNGSVCYNSSVSDFGTQGNFPGTNTPINDHISSIEVFDRSDCRNGYPPDPPTPISPLIGYSFNEGETITLSWTATGDDYFGEIWGGPGGTLTFGWQSGTSKNIGPQWAGYVYTWHVKARNSYGTSDWSFAPPFIVRPGAPNSLSASVVSCSQINLSWADNSGNEEGYKVFRNGNLIATLPSGTTSYQDTGLSQSTSYSYYVIAYRGNVESNASNAVSTTTSACRVLLSVTKTGSGTGTVTSSPAGINCGADCSELYAPNTTVTLTASAAAESAFMGWSGGCSGTGICTVPMTADTAVTANFAAFPGLFNKSLPTNRAMGQPTTLTLSWGTSSGAGSYSYCYDTTNDGVCSPWINNGASTSTTLSGLSYGTPYFWQVRAANGASVRYAENSSTAFWSFRTRSAPVTLTFTATVEDGWVLESAETSNVGGTMDAITATFNVGDGAGDKQYRSLLSFNTASLPDNAVITAVTFKVMQQGVAGTNPFTTHGNLMMDLKTGAFGGSNALQLTDFQAAANKSGVVIPNTPAAGWYVRNLPANTLTFVNKVGVTQFRLRFALDDNDDLAADLIRFFSGNAVAANRPKLIVQYYIP